MTIRTLFRSLLLASTVAASAAAADDNGPAIRRPSFGFRIEWFDTPMFRTTYVATSTTNPAAAYTYSGTTDSPRWAVEPTAEYRVLDRLSISAGLCFHHAQYQQTSTVTENSATNTIAQTSTANYWEFPFLAHYYGFGSGRWWSKPYVSAGLQFRHIGRVRTGTDYIYSDDTTNYNEIPAVPNRSNQLGFVAGVGLRFIDDFNIKMTPEIRFIRWQGETFEGPAYRSMTNQLEVGVGLVF
jgi:hypothetical protein